MTVVFVVASGLGVAAFTSQVSEQPLPLGILNSVRFPGDAKIVSKWAVRLKSSAINPKKMMGNVFFTDIQSRDHPRGSSGAKIAKEPFFRDTLYQMAHLK